MTTANQPPAPHASAQRCATCKHWLSRVPNIGVGQCRANPPQTSFSWPRTREEDWCNSWAATDSAAPTGPAASAPADAQGNLITAQAEAGATAGPAFARGKSRPGPRRS